MNDDDIRLYLLTTVQVNFLKVLSAQFDPVGMTQLAIPTDMKVGR